MLKLFLCRLLVLLYSLLAVGGFLGLAGVSFGPLFLGHLAGDHLGSLEVLVDQTALVAVVCFGGVIHLGLPEFGSGEDTMHLDLKLKGCLKRLVFPLENRAKEDVTGRLCKVGLFNFDCLGVEHRCPK